VATSSQISKSSHYINEFTRIGFVPAQPNYYYCDLGQFYLQHQNYPEAINSFNKALESEKEPLHRAEILYFLGCSCLPDQPERQGLAGGQAGQVTNNQTQAKSSFDSAKQLCDKIIGESTSEEAKTKAKTLLTNITNILSKQDKPEEKK
jgi:tetratricopeptide (TPR) repeat protein